MKSLPYKRVYSHLAKIYPDHDLTELTRKIIAIFEPPDRTGKTFPGAQKPAWSETDVILITYGNSIVENGVAPLKTLDGFLGRYLDDLVTIVHILPFFPFSSDDGFAVKDYYTVNPELGQWDDIRMIASKYRLMGDLVINHTSAEALWFENFKKGIKPGKDFYVTVGPECDVSKVIRPRTTPLLKEVETPDGTCRVWCTFSHDQIDLDFKNPDVLLEFLSIIRFYIDRGISVFRLDAVAFLWKESCTTCLHLDQTHEMIKLFRTLCDAFHPQTLIITETNVPSKENLSYLGNEDEAHIVYNFPLPPLLIHTLTTGNPIPLVKWLSSQPQLQANTTFLNFIASHDGIGLRPVETHLSDQEQKDLLTLMASFGGKISTRSIHNHQNRPYEINISLWDALKGTVESGPDLHQHQRFICAHAIMLSLKGIPAFYIHSLLSTENDYDRRDRLNSLRAVNRHVWDKTALTDHLRDPESHHHQVLEALKTIMELRKKQPAFHPDADQMVMPSESGLLILVRRAGMENDQRITCVYNIENRTRDLCLSDIFEPVIETITDLTTGKPHGRNDRISFEPYAFAWLETV